MTKISVEVVNFGREMERVRDEVRRLGNSSIKEKISHATKTLRIVTPVDTGEARLGWKSKHYRGLDGYTEGTISNDVDHIEFLNNGSSKQAPKYFIEQVLMTIGIITPN